MADAIGSHQRKLGAKNMQTNRANIGRRGGGNNSIFIGGMAHELGHALGLPHCRGSADETQFGTALMGSGNRTYGDEIRNEGSGTFLSRAHALRLASHPQFSGSLKGFGHGPRGCLQGSLADGERRA